ncbi:hypothetical protein P4C99_00005 [Pontiellaceae bacterium B1224]|nr:hypothetical protein [Pontiellaceae bacterium B1224]
MHQDLATDYSAKQWANENHSKFSYVWKRILLPAFILTALMVFLKIAGASKEIRIPVQSVELHAESFYSNTDFKVQYKQRESDTKPMLYVSHRIDFLTEIVQWFVVGLAVAIGTSTTTSFLASKKKSEPVI